ncbi:unnamed protein product, partial [Adineta steineri]
METTDVDTNALLTTTTNGIVDEAEGIWRADIEQS